MSPGGEKRLPESGENLEYKGSGIYLRHECMEPKKSTWILHTTVCALKLARGQVGQTYSWA